MLGDQVSRGNFSNSQCSYRSNQSEANGSMGLVRCKSEGSLEEHIPSYPYEPRAGVVSHYGPSMAALAEPMVEVYNGRPRPHVEMEICLEELPGRFAKIGLL